MLNRREDGLRVNVEYMRTAKKSYMIVKGANFPYEKYELKMIMHNDISCLLPFQMIKAEGEDEYWYEVGGMQSLRNIFVMDPVGEKQIRLILTGIMEMKSAMEEYLLDDENICFPSDMVYYDRLNERIKFCYIPGLGAAQTDDMTGTKFVGVKVLFEEILKYLDHGDPTAVRIGYEMYDRCVRAPFMTADCMDCLNMAAAEKKGMEMISTSPVRPVTSGSGIMESGRGSGVRDRDLSWLEEREPASDIFKDDEDDMEFLRDTAQTGQRHKKRNRKDKEKKDKIKKNRRKSPGRERHSADERELLLYNEDEYLDDEDSETGATEFLSPAEARKSWELVYRGDGVEEDIYPKESPFVIGSDPSRSDGVLKARTVSRVHARLYTEDDRLFVEDFNSTNGTYVNNRLLPMNTPEELHDGDRLVFATEEYQVWCRRC